jgi:hypothetical protein
VTFDPAFWTGRALWLLGGASGLLIIERVAGFWGSYKSQKAVVGIHKELRLVRLELRRMQRRGKQ